MKQNPAAECDPKRMYELSGACILAVCPVVCILDPNAFLDKEKVGCNISGSNGETVTLAMVPVSV